MNIKHRATRVVAATGGAALLLSAIWLGPWMMAGPAASADNLKPAAGTVKKAVIDLDKAIEVTLPDLTDDLKPAQFKTADGRSGWAIKLPGGRPIATPAYWNGILFVGGGYGSHEFYALNAQTGAVVWQIKTSDDGPTAAVVEDGYVAFNTESCTVIVCDAKTGKVLWQEWLGDPLMSQPAISKGRLYIAHPAGQRGGQSNTQQLAQPNIQANAPQTAQSGRATGHRLLCADLKTGRHLWDQQITADVISAPVVSGDQVFFTCFDGASFCLNAASGNLVWKKENSGTSAPLIAGGQLVMTQKETRDGKAYEGLKRIDAARGVEKDKKLLAESDADYLEANKGGGVGLSQGAAAKLDASVGFSTAPSGANLGAANAQVGVNSVVGGWAYQGSRATFNRGRMMNAQGRFLNCIQSVDGKFAWRAEVTGTKISGDSQIFSPPALGDANMYLSSAQGHLISVSQRDGNVRFLYSLKQPMAFQPALARGNVYVGTANGMLICLSTGDRDADGWYAWGGNAQHNK